jgi:hypothetical protein
MYCGWSCKNVFVAQNQNPHSTECASSCYTYSAATYNLHVDDEDNINIYSAVQILQMLNLVCIYTTAFCRNTYFMIVNIILQWRYMITVRDGADLKNKRICSDWSSGLFLTRR